MIHHFYIFALFIVLSNVECQYICFAVIFAGKALMRMKDFNVECIENSDFGIFLESDKILKQEKIVTDDSSNTPVEKSIDETVSLLVKNIFEVTKEKEKNRLGIPEVYSKHERRNRVVSHRNSPYQRRSRDTRQSHNTEFFPTFDKSFRTVVSSVDSINPSVVVKLEPASDDEITEHVDNQTKVKESDIKKAVYLRTQVAHESEESMIEIVNDTSDAATDNDCEKENDDSFFYVYANKEYSDGLLESATEEKIVDKTVKCKNVGTNSDDLDNGASIGVDGIHLPFVEEYYQNNSVQENLEITDESAQADLGNRLETSLSTQRKRKVGDSCKYM